MAKETDKPKIPESMEIDLPLKALRTQDGRVLITAHLTEAIMSQSKLDRPCEGGQRVVIAEVTDEVEQVVEHNGMKRGYRKVRYL